MRLYGLKTCDTCRKALKALAAAGHDVEFVDVRATPLGPEDRGRFVAAFGEAVINRRSTTWKTMDDAARAEAPAAMIAAHPTVMKRPVIDADGVLYLGWDAAVRTALV